MSPLLALPHRWPPRQPVRLSDRFASVVSRPSSEVSRSCSCGLLSTDYCQLRRGLTVRFVCRFALVRRQNRYTSGRTVCTPLQCVPPPIDIIAGGPSEYIKKLS